MSKLISGPSFPENKTTQGASRKETGLTKMPYQVALSSLLFLSKGTKPGI